MTEGKLEKQSIARRLAAAAIMFFLCGFVMMIVTLLAVTRPGGSITLNTEEAIMYMIGIVLFEAMTALPCTVISFVVLIETTP